MNTLVGSWKLKSHQVTDKLGETKDWQGGGAEGLLIYTANGQMSVSINARPNTLAEVRAPKVILDRCLFYAGSYELKDREVHHSVSLATNSDRIGTTLVRNYVLNGNQLVLTSSGDFGTARITWEKI